ncbi:MAG: ATP-dependent Clp protease ATP-binding subunit [Candidatus Buchananbacteria bacterium]|nr:ATP-dependent Clp protease ATP-binding subunit [Candidatus Buchananbacteria bacterium]
MAFFSIIIVKELDIKINFSMSLPFFSYSTLPLVLLVVLVAIIFFMWRKGGASGPYNASGNATPTLNQYAKDLTKMAADGKLDPVIGRNEEIERVIQVLSRRTKNNPVLVGKSGVGKTAIAEGLAQMIAGKKVPKILENKKVLALDLTGIIAGTKYRGEFEKRIKQIADEITAAKRSIILFIDEIHTLAEAGGAEGAIDADDILKPALARGDLQVIGATTAEEYKKFIKKDVTLDRRLHPILVDEPTKEETVKILEGIKRKYEQFHKVNITKEAILAAVHLAEQHIKNKSFPDKAIDLMDEAASKVSIENVTDESTAKKTTSQKRLADKKSWPQVGVAEVQEVMQEWQENKFL